MRFDQMQGSSWVFFGMTLAVAAVLGVPGALATHGHLPAAAATPLLAGAVFSPGLVALWLTWRHQGREGIQDLVGRLMAWRAPWWAYAAAVAIPFAVNATAAGLAPLFGGDVSDLRGGLAPEQQVAWWLLPALFLVPSAMEELGWRGYALPRLQQRHSALAASVVVGLVWAVWHLPLGLVAGSPQGAIPFGWYTVAAVAVAVTFTWLHNATGGTLGPVIVLHAGVQIANVAVPVLPSTSGEATAYLLSVVVYVALAGGLLAAFGPKRLAVRHGSGMVRARESTSMRPSGSGTA